MRDAARREYADDTRYNARVELHQRFGGGPFRVHRAVFDQLRLPADAAVLELGCGSGHFWAANAERVPAGWTIVLADLSPGMIAAARVRLGGRFAYALADAEALPLPAGRFDAAIANHMLYHVPDRRRAVREIARVVRPDGVLYAATNGRDHMRELAELAARWVEAGLIHRSSEAFGLENGAEQLRAGFARVDVDARHGELVVTEAEPVVAYVRSLVGDGWDGDPLRREVAMIIEREGAFRITTHTGLLVARSPIQSGT